jgi:tetratricopeptide (TPR) repeat protein
MARYGDKIFIGRTVELNQFQQCLENSTQNNHAWILNIHGDGGIGKSQLIQAFAEKSQENSLVTGILIDLAITSHKTESGILRSLAKQLFSPENYDKFVGQVGAFGESFDSLISLRKEFIPYYQQLNAKHLILLFDTTEQLNDNAKYFLNNTLIELKKTNNATFVIAAGRPQKNSLAPFDELEKYLVTPLFLNPLSTLEVDQYFQQAIPEENIDENTKQKLIKLSQGRPILVALIVDWANNGNDLKELANINPDQFERELVLKIVTLRTPEDEGISLMAFLHRRFDEEIWHYISGGLTTLEEIRKALNKLAKFSFVKVHVSVNSKNPTKYALHDEFLVFLLKYIHSLPVFFSSDVEKNRCLRMVVYYANKISKETDEIKCQEFERERLYYCLKGDLEKGIEYWRQLRNKAITSEIQKAVNGELDDFIDKLSILVQFELELAKAIALYDDGNYVEAAKLLENLIVKLLRLDDSEQKLILEARSKARLVLCYAQNRETLDKAIEVGEQYKEWFANLENTAQLTEKIKTYQGRLFNNLGFAYRANGDIEQAINHYTQAINIYRSIPNDSQDDQQAITRTNLAYVLDLYSPEGSRQAMQHITTAIQIKLRTGSPPSSLGLTYNVQGILETHSRLYLIAFTCFEKALKQFEKAKNKRGEAMVYLAYAHALRQFGWYLVRPQKHNRENYQRNLQTKEYYEKAGQMLGKAIDIFKSIESPQLLDSLHEQGCLFREQAQYDKALEYFYKAKEECNKKYLLVKILSDIAIIYQIQANLPNKTQSESVELKQKTFGYATQATQIGLECKAYHFVSRAQRTKADILIDYQQYEEAVNTAKDSILNLVKVDLNVTENPATKGVFLSYWLEWFTDFLPKLPQRDRFKYAQYLIQEWSKQESLEFEPFIEAAKAIQSSKQ